MTDLLLFSLIGGLFSLVGGLVLLWNAKLVEPIIVPLIAFGAGAFVAAGFLDILPEALEAAGEPHDVLLSTVVGFTLFFALERLLMRYIAHRHDNGHSEHTEPLPYLLILSDSLHNFLDGIIIGLAYIANPMLGLPTTLAIAAHEVPQEIGDFSILLHLKWKKAHIIGINIFQSVMTIPGVFIGYFLGQAVEPFLPYFLGATAGIFIYIAASDLIPELHHRSGHKQILRVVIPFVVGIIVLWRLAIMAHGQ